MAAGALAGGVAPADSWSAAASGGALGAARALFEEELTLPGWQAPPSVAASPSVRAARALASVASGSASPHVSQGMVPVEREHVTVAGESLRSLVSPTTYVAPGASPGSAPAVAARGYEVPSAAPDVVRTGAEPIAPAPPASSGSNGSEWQVPSWFEDVARKMLGSKGADETVGLPELTLVTAAASSPRPRMAAAEKRISAAPTQVTQKGNGSPNKELLKEEDINQLARDVYDEIRRIIDAARERNGDLWRA